VSGFSVERTDKTGIPKAKLSPPRIRSSSPMICRIQKSGRTCSVPLPISRAARTLSPNNIITRYLNHHQEIFIFSTRFEAVGYSCLGNVSCLYRISNSKLFNHAISVGPTTTPLRLSLRSPPCFTVAYQQASGQ
jgi:hypothetical protein